MSTSRTYPLHAAVLPLELWDEILEHLPRRDLHHASLLCRRFKRRAQGLLFRNIVLKVPALDQKLDRLYRASQHIKSYIRSLDIGSGARDWSGTSERILFSLLPTLPNLQRFDYTQIHHLLPNPPADRKRLLEALRHAPLRFLSLNLNDGYWPVPRGQPLSGPVNLRSLAIKWHNSDNPWVLGSSLEHLHEFIRPSLDTLVELKLDVSSSVNFDLHFLQPASKTMRSLDYTSPTLNEEVLTIIPMVLPRLTRLGVKWLDRTKDHSLLWKDEHINSLCKNEHLTDLTLSCDFSDDRIFASGQLSALRGFARRLEATGKLSAAMPRLQRCNWVRVSLNQSTDLAQDTLEHAFVLEERFRSGCVERILRCAQQGWMGLDCIMPLQVMPEDGDAKMKLGYAAGDHGQGLT